MTRILLLIFISAAGVAAAVTRRSIDDASAAIAVAEKAFVAKFGDRAVSYQRPFTARLFPTTERSEASWTVRGRDPDPRQFGGVMLARVRKEDGHVLDVWMSK